MAVITLSRQVGSGGDEIAQRVCELLHYNYFDKRLMVQTAAEVGLSEQEVIDFSEDRHEVRSFFTRLFRQGGPVARVAVRERDAEGRETLSERELDAAECVDLVRVSVQTAYKAGRIVIVGRGGQAILQNQPGVFHVRVIAPTERRIERLRSQGIIGISDITATITTKDRASADYLKRFYGVDLEDLMLYHMVINTGKTDIETAAQMIVTAAKQIEAPATA